MNIIENWQDEWQKSVFEDVNVIIAYDDDYDYFLRCHHHNGKRLIQINKVEATSGEKWAIAGPVLIQDTVIDLMESIRWHGEDLVERWLEENAEL